MKQFGFSLIEMLIVLAIVLIVFSMAAPAFQHQINLGKISRVLDSVSSQFSRAQLVAMQTNQAVHVSLNHSGHWCLHVSMLPCNCQKPSTCSSVVSIPTINYYNHNPVKIVNNTFNPAGFTRFAPSTGLTAGHAGAITFNAGDVTGKVILSNMGRTRTCLLNQQYGHIEQC